MSACEKSARFTLSAAALCEALPEASLEAFKLCGWPSRCFCLAWLETLLSFRFVAPAPCETNGLWKRPHATDTERRCSLTAAARQGSGRSGLECGRVVLRGTGHSLERSAAGRPARGSSPRWCNDCNLRFWRHVYQSRHLPPHTEGHSKAAPRR